MRFWDINCSFFILVDMQEKNSTDRLYLAKVIIRLTVDICFFEFGVHDWLPLNFTQDILWTKGSHSSHSLLRAWGIYWQRSL